MLLTPISKFDSEGIKWEKLGNFVFLALTNAGISTTMLTPINRFDSEGIKWEKLGAAMLQLAENISGGGGGGVTQIVAGTGISLSPPEGTGAVTVTNTNTATGDVVGPASATDNAISRFDTTTGKLIQNSGAFVTDSGAVVGKTLVASKTQAVSPYSVLATESRTAFDNTGSTGAVVFTLPTAAADLSYTFTCTDTDGITITANTGDTIRIAGSVTATAGSIASTVIGSSVRLIAVDATQWIAVSLVGTFTI